PLFQQKLQIKSYDIRKKFRSERVFYDTFEVSESKIKFKFKKEDLSKIKSILSSKDINSIDAQGSNQFLFNINNDEITLNFNDAYFNLLEKNALEQSLEIIRSRIDEVGTK
ncbi:MAG: protein translocase subunit SecD, partial [Pelagibacteraceae bacterium]